MYLLCVGMDEAAAHGLGPWPYATDRDINGIGLTPMQTWAQSGCCEVRGPLWGQSPGPRPED